MLLFSPQPAQSPRDPLPGRFLCEPEQCGAREYEDPALYHREKPAYDTGDYQ